MEIETEIDRVRNIIGECARKASIQRQEEILNRMSRIEIANYDHENFRLTYPRYQSVKHHIRTDAGCGKQEIDPWDKIKKCTEFDIGNRRTFASEDAGIHKL